MQRHYDSQSLINIIFSNFQIKNVSELISHATHDMHFRLSHWNYRTCDPIRKVAHYDKWQSRVHFILHWESQFGTLTAATYSTAKWSIRWAVLIWMTIQLRRKQFAFDRNRVQHVLTRGTNLIILSQEWFQRRKPVIYSNKREDWAYICRLLVVVCQRHTYQW